MLEGFTPQTVSLGSDIALLAAVPVPRHRAQIMTENDGSPSKRRLWLSWVVIALIAAACAAIVGDAPSFRECVRQSGDAGTAIDWLRLRKDCVGTFTSDNDSAIAAVSALLVAVFTFTLWNATSRLWRSAEKQLAEFRRSLDQARAIADQQISEASRTAAAMELVAASIAESAGTTATMARDQREFWQRQMRAYLSVNYGTVVPQDNTTGWRTEVRMILVNTGHTPAHDVSYVANADVLPLPLPDDFEFPVPAFPRVISTSVIGPWQNLILRATIPHQLSDDEVNAYTGGSRKRVYSGRSSRSGTSSASRKASSSASSLSGCATAARKG